MAPIEPGDPVPPGPPAGTPTLVDLRAYLDLQSNKPGLDVFLERALASALLFAERYTGRIFDPLPVDYQDAVLTLAARRYLERHVGYGDQVVVGDGQEFQSTWIRSMPAGAKLILDFYRLPGIA